MNNVFLGTLGFFAIRTLARNGTTTTATISEAPIQKTRTFAKPLRIIPTMPPRKIIGMKTTMVVIDEAIIDAPTSSAPIRIASSALKSSCPI